MSSLQASIKVYSNNNKVTRKVKLSPSKLKNNQVKNCRKGKAAVKYIQKIRMKVKATKVKTKA